MTEIAFYMCCLISTTAARASKLLEQIVVYETDAESLAADASLEPWTEEENLAGIHASLSYENGGVFEYLCKKQRNVNLQDEFGATALHYVVAANRTEWARTLLNVGASANVRDEDGMTVLHLAAKYGYTEVVKLLLLESGNVDVDARDYDSWTAFNHAAHEGHADVVRLLLETEAYRGTVPLHLAIKENNVEVAMLLIGLKGSLERGGHLAAGLTAVHFAATMGRTSMIMEMVDEGCDLEAGDGEGNTVLMSALYGRNRSAETSDRLRNAGKSVEVVKALILLKASVFASNAYSIRTTDWAKKWKNYAALSVLLKEMLVKTNSGESVLPRLHLEVTKSEPDLKLVRELCRKDPNAKDFLDRSALHLAVEGNKLEIVKVLTGNGCDVTAQNALGNTALHGATSAEVMEELLKADGTAANVGNKSGHLPLHVACKHQRLDLATVLAPATANIDAVNLRFFSPLLIAVKLGNVALAECLLKRGAGKGPADPKLTSPLSLAAFSGRVDLVNLFLKYGLNAKSKTIGGEMPVHRAIHYGQSVDMVRALLDGVSPDVMDTFGSLLHWTMLFGNSAKEEVVEMLIEYGVPLNAVSYRGRTVILEAAERGFVQKVKIFLERGADLRQTTPNGESALHLAVDHDRENCVSVLVEADRALLFERDLKGKTPVDLILHRPEALYAGENYHVKNVLSIMALRGDEIQPQNLLIILKFQNKLFYEHLTNLKKLQPYEEYVITFLAFLDGDKYRLRYLSTKRYYTNWFQIYVEAGVGSFYSTAAAYYPELAKLRHRETDDDWHAVREECVKAVRDYEHSRQKGVYFSELKCMMVDIFAGKANRFGWFRGTYMNFVPQEAMEGVVIDVANNGDVLGRVELLANCMMLIFKGRDDVHKHRNYLMEKMGRLSEHIIKKKKYHTLGKRFKGTQIIK